MMTGYRPSAVGLNRFANRRTSPRPGSISRKLNPTASQRRTDYLAAAGEYEQALALLAGLRDQGKLPKSEWPRVDELAALAQKARRTQ